MALPPKPAPTGAAVEYASRPTVIVAAASGPCRPCDRCGGPTIKAKIAGVRHCADCRKATRKKRGPKPAQ